MASGDGREILTLNDFKVVKKAIFRARRKWRPMGTELGVSEDDLDNIEDEGSDNEECLATMVAVWLRKRSLRPSWKRLVEALRAETVGREDIACDIAEEYLEPKVKDVASMSTRTPNQKSALQAYVPLLKSRYQSNMPACTVQFPPPLTDTYTDLSLIKGQGPLQGGSAVREMVKLTVEGKVGDILQTSKEVQLKDLFKPDLKRKKVILIEGPPGSGKTTLSWHICQEWESGKLFTEFELVVYIQLRDPAIQKAQSIAELLPRRNDQMAKEVLAELEAKDGEGVLFVLDGWDELPGDLPQDSPLRQLIELALVCPLERCAVVITSRPEASTKLHSLASSRVQIVGFTPEKVEDYFTESLKGDSQAAKVLMEQVKENPAIEGSCYIPLNAAIIVTLFIVMGHQLPSTLTGVFVSLVAYCILRHCNSRAAIEIRSLSSLDKLPRALQTSFDSLCALAFQGILVNQITFSEEECEIYPEFATLSLLQGVEGFVGMGLGRTYNFLHLSIQELLAARHLSKLPADTQVEIVHGLLNHRRFTGVFRFYAGITHLHKPGIVCEMVHRCKQYREKGYLLELLLECLHEVEDPMLYQMVAEEWGGECLSLWSPSPVACLSAGYLLPRLPYPHIELGYLDDQRVVSFTKGLTNSCADHKQPRHTLSITLRQLILRGRNSLQAIAQLLSFYLSVSHLALEFISSTLSSEYMHVRPPIDPLDVLRCIGEEMARNTSVRSLELNILPPIKDLPVVNPVPQLCEMLERNKTLEKLKLTDCSVGVHVASVANGLMHNSSLKELVLCGDSIADIGAKSLGEMLMNNTALDTLDISGIHTLSLEGVRYLAEALKGNSKLRVLRLNNSVVRTIEPLAVALTVNTTLEKLHLVESQIEDSPMFRKFEDNLTTIQDKADRELDPEELQLPLFGSGAGSGPASGKLGAIIGSLFEKITSMDLWGDMSRSFTSFLQLPLAQVNVPGNVTEELMANGVLQQLLTIAIERTVSKFGDEKTGRALNAIMEEWGLPTLIEEDDVD